MESKGRYYITTAIAYASAKPHIGNTYEIVLADAIARYKRMEGYDVFFQTGTDEHGQKIEGKAVAAGMEPQAYVDKTAAEIRRIWDLMNTSYDKFIRTTDDYHVKQVQKMFRRMYEKGDIYKGEYAGMYCKACESFYTESQLEGGKCPDCGGPVEPAKEEAYFFRMSKYAPRLIDYINEHPEFIQPVARKNEMMNNFLLPGLTDLCVSRTSFKWGIPVDFDDKHVVYVWLDALTNYITGIGYDADGNSEPRFAYNWPADLHLIGKDIIRFHTIYWPIFLMSLDLPLPKQVFGHPWLLMNGGKMSKSKGNVMYADDLVSLFGVDAVRYFVLHEMPYDNDGIITWDLLIERINTDLANTLGNLVNRTVAMENKYFGGAVAKPAEGVSFGEAYDAYDEDLAETARKVFANVSEKMKELRVADAITEIFTLFKRCNRYIDENEPWVLAKDPAKKERLSAVLYNLLEGISTGAMLLAPFLPETAEKILSQTGAKTVPFDEIPVWGKYPDGGHVTEKPEILFARLDMKEMKPKIEAVCPGAFGEEEPEEKKDAPAKAAPAAAKADAAKKDAAAPAEEAPAEGKAEITYDAFDAMEFRVGEILECREVEKSRKLLCSKVSIGSRILQICSGIKEYYKPEDMVGRKVMVLVNLKPRKMAGLLSEGMLLCAEDENGAISLMTPADPSMPAGSVIC